MPDWIWGKASHAAGKYFKRPEPQRGWCTPGGKTKCDHLTPFDGVEKLGRAFRLRTPEAFTGGRSLSCEQKRPRAVSNQEWALVNFRRRYNTMLIQ